MGNILEVCMLVAFGFAWPTSIVKSWRSRTAVGKSPVFLVIVMLGYVCGAMSKVVTGEIHYSIFFYILNFLMVGTDLCLYFRNKDLDRAAR